MSTNMDNKSEIGSLKQITMETVTSNNNDGFIATWGNVNPEIVDYVMKTNWCDFCYQAYEEQWTSESICPSCYDVKEIVESYIINNSMTRSRLLDNHSNTLCHRNNNKNQRG